MEIVVVLGKSVWTDKRSGHSVAGSYDRQHNNIFKKEEEESGGIYLIQEPRLM